MTVQLRANVVSDVPISKLERDPRQPRKTFDPETLKGLGDSLKVRVQVPLLVRKGQGGKFVIVDGERRWRAAKLAGLTTLPCLLAGLEGQLEIGAAQLTTSQEREQLAPLDIGEFLVGLRKRERKSANELAAALAKQGIKGIGRETIERYMRLVELPAWTKDLLRAGKIGETAALVVLEALPFNGVAKAMHQDFTRELHWKGEITAKEAQDILRRGIAQRGIDLNRQYGAADEIRAFPIEPCRKCEWHKRIGGQEFCMNRAEYEKKQAAGLLEKQARAAARAEKRGEGDALETDPTKVKPRVLKFVGRDKIAVLGRIQHFQLLRDARFDVATCDGCPHKHQASRDGKPAGAEATCFWPPCFEVKQRVGHRQAGRTQRMREHLEEFLRPIVQREIGERASPRTCMGLVLWLATGAARDFRAGYTWGQDPEKAAQTGQAFLSRWNLRNLSDVVLFGESKLEDPHWREIMSAAVPTLDREQLRWLALHLQVALDDPATRFRIDEVYLRMKRKSELQALAKIAGFDTVADLGVLELRAKLLEPASVEAIGVPEDIARLYAEAFEQPGADELDELDEGDFDIGELSEEDLNKIGDGLERDEPTPRKGRKAA